MPRVLGGSWVGEHFLMGAITLYEISNLAKSHFSENRSIPLKVADLYNNCAILRTGRNCGFPTSDAGSLGRTFFSQGKGVSNTRHDGIRLPRSHFSSYTSILGDM